MNTKYAKDLAYCSQMLARGEYSQADYQQGLHNIVTSVFIVMRNRAEHGGLSVEDCNRSEEAPLGILTQCVELLGGYTDENVKKFGFDEEALEVIIAQSRPEAECAADAQRQNRYKNLTNDLIKLINMAGSVYHEQKDDIAYLEGDVKTWTKEFLVGDFQDAADEYIQLDTIDGKNISACLKGLGEIGYQGSDVLEAPTLGLLKKLISHTADVGHPLLETELALFRSHFGVAEMGLKTPSNNGPVL